MPMKRLVAVWAAIVLAVSLGGVAPAAASPAATVTGQAETGIAKAADLTRFTPGNIIGDAVFFNRSSMTESQIQAFLQARVPACATGYTCLKDYYDTSRVVAADAMCGAYNGGVRERASRIIWRVAQACGINPQVILVTLQKEQSLVTRTAPTATHYRIAMGQGCPDTAACDTRYYGFFNQVYGAAWQFKRYANPPGTSRYFTWYAPGRTWNILYHPNTACGTSPVTIQNQATANLYYYTPYQPNAASLAAGYNASPNTCASYGNRNFYAYFTDWFGSTQYSSFTAAPTPTVSGSAVAGQVLRATAGTWSPAPSSLTYQWLRNGAAVSGATAASYSVTNADAGATLSVRVVARRTNYLTTTRTSATLGATGFAVARIAGASRYDTAVAVSKRQHAATVGTVYLATGLDYADALSAAPRAAAEGAALLLTPPNAMPAAVATELRRLAPTRVVLIGGPGVLDAGTEQRVRAALGAQAQISRVFGADRYETSRLLAQNGQTRPTVYVATGRLFPDALGAAAVAGGAGAPVLLVDGTASTIDAATTEALRAMGARTAVIVGASGVVSAGIETALRNRGLSVTRYGGADRFATNAALNAGSFGAANPVVYVSVWNDFPDALSGSVIAASTGAPMFVSLGTCLSGQTADFIRTRGTTQVTLVGGAGVLGPNVAALRRC
ncbi:cell wall-binding repeat-containing protein [Microbacterium hominis]|uniref:Cell wall-binding repeat-containing protein n=1 Tax=Microbacterium hominis TaxID=162426 RepID=A0A7D4PVS8_9MICO|nr:cell wall-binding repeat-containing protein [Microbacterium hominis]QKJ20034.1 cell wall-binding repeat-containing protein [Microbacterium hominis]